MNNLKTNIKFEEFIGKLPYGNNTSESDGVLVIHEIEGEPPGTLKTQNSSGTSSVRSFYLDKTLNEILNACENDIPIIKQIEDTKIENQLCSYIGYFESSMQVDIQGYTYNIIENNYLIRFGKEGGNI